APGPSAAATSTPAPTDGAGPAPAALATNGAAEHNENQVTEGGVGGPLVDPTSTADTGYRQGGEGGILSNAPAAPLPPGGPTGEDRRYLYTEDDRRMYGPLIIGAVIGLLVLLGVGGYLISQAGGEDEEGDGLTVETAEGPSTSLSATGNESTGRSGDGGRGTLESNSDDNGLGSDTTGIDPVDAVVPDVVGMSAVAARSQLSALGFEVNTVDEESPSVPVGDVIRQSPSASSSIPDGATVTIYVAKDQATDTVLVPSLTGMTRAEAESALTDLGLSPGATVSREPHATVAIDTVISTSPVGGSTVNLESVVSLVLSDGPAAPQCADMVGLSEAAATARLEAAGLSVSTTSQPSTTVASGNVISCTQTETSGNLVISTGVDLCAQAIGQDRGAARSLLEGQGLTVTETAEPGSAAVDEVVACSINGTSASITYATALPTDCSSVEGRTVQQARNTLQNQGFADITVTLVPSNSVPKNEVISCSISGPAATLTVSDGQPNVTVPDVVGLRRSAGLTMLRDMGLEIGGPQEVDSTRPQGEILAIQPGAGASVAPGTVIDVVVSNGNPPRVQVPDVLGLSQGAAAAAVNSASLVPAFDTVPVPEGSPNIGLVVSVSPRVGRSVDAGSTVTMTIAVSSDDD
ncbi:MAG: PASTA domain-containing protein, partial [Acidimicrobiales bacterium]